MRAKRSRRCVSLVNFLPLFPKPSTKTCHPPQLLHNQALIFCCSHSPLEAKCFQRNVGCPERLLEHRGRPAVPAILEGELLEGSSERVRAFWLPGRCGLLRLVLLTAGSSRWPSR